jgi:hypothetical protein
MSNTLLTDDGAQIITNKTLGGDLAGGGYAISGLGGLNLEAAAADLFQEIYVGSGYKAGLKLSERTTGEYGVALYHDGTENEFIIQVIDENGDLSGELLTIQRITGRTTLKGPLYMSAPEIWSTTYSLNGSSHTVAYNLGIAGTSSVSEDRSFGVISLPPKNITTPATGTCPVIATMNLSPPDITSGGATITNATTLFIDGAPTEGSNNYSLQVREGKTLLGGDVEIGGALTTADHGTATDPEVVSVVYGTGSPPTASTTPIGTLFIQYTP